MPRIPLERDTCRDYVLPALKAAGWGDDQIVEQQRITDGRIIAVGARHRRDRPLVADYVLEYRPGVPVAVVEAKREHATAARGLQQAVRYRELLDLSLAYSTNGHSIIESDADSGLERDDLTAFPSPEEAWERYGKWRGLSSPVAEGLTLPFNRSVRNFDGSPKEPRYYQQVAINRAVERVLAGDRRLLLTMATGTGKTFTAMQIVWKLWSSSWKEDRKPRVLYLADRTVLIDQPQRDYFTPAFGADPLWRIRGEAKSGREIYFALYQGLSDSGDGTDGVFRQFASDYFDVVIVDECHRGSARESSSWRRVLEHFAPATQIGMTATPKREDTVDSYRYFGDPIFEYSLAQGIEDGFLAPYRVRRVVLSPDAHGWSPEPGQLDRFGKEIPPGLYGPRQFERVVSLLTRTEAAARHLTNYLRRTDRFGKTIVFCVDQEHADQMRRALHNANADLTRQHPDYVVRIVSDEGELGLTHLSNMSDAERSTPVIATSSQMLSTGVDLPTVRNIVLFRPVGSMALFKQMIGRGTRLAADHDKLSFDIIDYSGATRLFADPAFDGPPESIDEEEIDGDGTIVSAPVVEEPQPDPTPSPEGVDPEDFLPAKTNKFYIDDTEVWVTSEAVYHLDPETEKLRLVEYRDHVADVTRTLFTDPRALRSRWATRTGRQSVLEELDARGIDGRDLGARIGIPDADPLDALVHLAWNEPIATRFDRIRRVQRERSEFFERFRPEAREVLRALVEKYAEHGIDQLDDLAVLRVPPLTNLGSPTQIASRFGTADDLRSAVSRLSELLYAA